jgi:uncharacterized membrane protein YbhN (UPF0104 family)
MANGRRRALGALKVLVSVVLLAWVLRAVFAREGVDALGARFVALDGAAVVAAVLLHVLSVLLGIVRWDALLRARGHALRFVFLARSYLVGRFAGAFTPSTAGLDVVRTLDVRRATGSVTVGAAVLAAEKAVGVLGLALVCAALAVSGGEILPRGPALACAALAAVAALALLAALARPARLAPLFSPLPARMRGRVLAWLEALPPAGLAPRTLAKAVALGLCAHLAVSAVYVATGRALGVTASPLALLIVGNAIVVATLLPISVGGIGVREGVAVALLARIGVDPADATLLALLGYLTGQVPAVVGGLLTLVPAPDSAARPPARDSFLRVGDALLWR